MFLFCFFTTTVPHFVDMTSLFLLFNADSFHMFALLLAGWLENQSPTAVDFAFAVIPLVGLCVFGDVFQL